MSNQPLTVICQWHLAKLPLALQQIIRVFLWDETAVKPNKSARRHDECNNQCLGSPCRLPGTYSSRYWRGTHKRGTHQSKPISRWEFIVCIIKPWRRSARTPRTDNDKRGLHNIDGFRVCAAAQPGQLPSYHWKRPRPSAWN